MARCTLVITFILFSFISSAQQGLTLENCLQIGLENNISLNQNSLDIERSQLSLNQSKANMLPNLNASASHGYNWGQTIDPFTNQFASNRIQSNSFGLNTGVVLYNGFSLQNQVKQAELSLKISRLGLETNRNAIALAVANSYLSVLFNQEVEAVNKSNLLSSQEQLDRIQLLVDAGQVPEANLYQIQAQVALDESRVVNSENAIIIAKLNLMQLIQLPESQRAGFDIVKPDMETPDFVLPEKSSVISHALGNFPEVKSAELGVANAELSYKIANGSRLPRLTANYNYGTGFSGARQLPVGDPVYSAQLIGLVAETAQEVYTAVPSYSDFETVSFTDQVESNVNRSLFFSLNIPIFNGFSNRTNVQLAKINQLNAELISKDTKNQLQQSVESAFADANAAYKTYQAADLSLKAQEEAFKYAKIRYEQQVINGVDFGQARNNRDAANAEKIRSLYDYIFRLKILEFYQGKPITLN